MLKPMDIHNMEFKRTFKGYDPDEVDSFLANIVSKYETVYQENRRLQQELETLRRAAESPGKGHSEHDLRDLIALTKQTVDEVKHLANQEADNVVSLAQSEAERIIVEARLRSQHMLADAEERLEKTERAERLLREKVRLTMETIWNSLIEEHGDSGATRPYHAPAMSADEEALED